MPHPKKWFAVFKKEYGGLFYHHLQNSSGYIFCESPCGYHEVEEAKKAVQKLQKEFIKKYPIVVYDMIGLPKKTYPIWAK